ncbi:MAG TPA: dihydrofolate reductase family protein [Solirubrobacteraceae bacterium]|nr:dihydrofolate reductase family protein [Solirubrobacteraceae bacterium]
MTRPYVVVHTAVSLDGATTGYEPDVGRFYALARTWNEDVTLTGADTILAQQAALAAVPRPGPAAGGPLLAVVDGRHRVEAWAALRDCGHWRDVVALRATAADGRVDLARALAMLAERHGARTVRVDSGGGLSGALLARGLVDEVSLLVHPVVAGTAGDRRWQGPGPLPPVALVRIAAEPLDGGLVWLRFAVERGSGMHRRQPHRP